MAVDHVYIHESVFERFKELMLSKLNEGFSSEQYQSGNFGRIINEARFDRLTELLKDKHEGKILYGGNIEKDKMYFAPTVVENPKRTSLMMQEEIFGPILPIFSYQQIDSVLEEINGRDRPLAVYVFSESKRKVAHIK